MPPSPIQTFRPVHRGHLWGQALIFLVFAIACLIQSLARFGASADRFWNAWWFFLLLAMGFLYFVVEALYKIFFQRLVLTPDGFVQYDFLRVTRVSWKQVKQVGPVETQSRKKALDFGILLKDSAVENPNVLSLPFISLTPYFRRWNDSPLQEWFKEHKPGLLR
ncbi:MAG: hypothetical protein N2049_04830 [Anaerolineales bacterium]|nr:hypothetical protein [Anaerolineales bacterium]MDW8226768.1 hypothetical protein [Anaerolineales bacterium]